MVDCLVFNVPVYPCVYREHIKKKGSISINIGLSLCIQGTRGYTRKRARFKRFIPVYTGNTYISERPTTLTAVYPCVYREHDVAIVTTIGIDGLSLCIQGTLQL